MAVIIIAAGLIALVFLNGLILPVNVHSLIGLVLLRPQLRKIRRNLLIGNRHIVFLTPLMVQWLSPAWNAQDIVNGLRKLIEQADRGMQVYYPVTRDMEIELGLYCLRGDKSERKPYVLLFAGGGFTSVCTLLESLPVAAAFQEHGYTIFAGNYHMSERFGVPVPPERITDDIAAQISFIEGHAEELNVLTDHYLIGGFSAGSVSVSDWCDPSFGYAQHGLTKPGTVCYIYGFNEDLVDTVDIPAYILFCHNDPYFEETLAERVRDSMQKREIPVIQKLVSCPHGFGLGTGTEAENWHKEAIYFWEQQYIADKYNVLS